MSQKTDANIVMSFRFVWRLPFQWKNPFGYLIAFAIEYTSGIYIIDMMVCQTSLVIGCYWLLISLALDISRDLFKIIGTKMNPLQLKRELTNYIRAQSDAKQLSERELMSS